MREDIAGEKPSPRLLRVVTSDLPSPRASDVHVCLWLTMGGLSGWSTMRVRQPLLGGGGSRSFSSGGLDWGLSSLAAPGSFLAVSIVEKSKINWRGRARTGSLL